MRYSRRGWHVPERADVHVHLGPIWALVSTGTINVHVTNPDTIHDIVTRRGDFQRPSAELSAFPRITETPQAGGLTMSGDLGALRTLHLDGKMARLAAPPQAHGHAVQRNHHEFGLGGIPASSPGYAAIMDEFFQDINKTLGQSRLTCLRLSALVSLTAFGAR